MTTALITGGTRGLGLELAAALAHQGWDVVVDGRDEHVLRAALVRIGPNGIGVAGDVTDPDHRTKLAAAAARTGRLDLLVNNASTLGASPLPRLRDLAPATAELILHTNVVAPLALFQATRSLLVAARGSVVNITSDAAVEPYEGWGGYGSSKAALDHLSAVLAVEEPALRVWAVDPGDMRTQMHQDAFPGEDISDRPHPATVVPALLHLIGDRPPSGRVRTADLLGARR